jgi:phosphocarrier protein
MTGPPVAERRVTIRNQRGLHARAAAKFVKTAERFQARVTVNKDGCEVPGTSIMGLMMLAAAPGTELGLRAEGEQREAALDALEDLIERRFDEDG